MTARRDGVAQPQIAAGDLGHVIDHRQAKAGPFAALGREKGIRARVPAPCAEKPGPVSLT